MGPLSTVLVPDLLRSISAASFTGLFQPIGGPLLQPCRIIKFLNDSTVPCFISWDGVNIHEYLPSGSFLLLDVSTNKENAIAFDIQAGTQFYVQAGAGVGTVTISNYYGK